MTVSINFYFDNYKADAPLHNLLIVKQYQDFNLSNSSQYDSGFSKMVVILRYNDKDEINVLKK